MSVWSFAQVGDQLFPVFAVECVDVRLGADDVLRQSIRPFPFVGSIIGRLGVAWIPAETCMRGWSWSLQDFGDVFFFGWLKKASLSVDFFDMLDDAV